MYMSDTMYSGDTPQVQLLPLKLSYANMFIRQINLLQYIFLEERSHKLSKNKCGSTITNHSR